MCEVSERHDIPSLVPDHNLLYVLSNPLCLPSGEVSLEAGVLYDWHDDLLVVSEGAALGWVPDALDHLDVLHLELVAVKHGGEDDVLAVALQDGTRVAV